MGTSIYWGYFTVSSQEVSTMALAISFDPLFKVAEVKAKNFIVIWHISLLFDLECSTIV
jgi:carbon starvation protein CstA